MKSQLIIALFLFFTSSTIFADENDIPVVEYHICYGIRDRDYIEPALIELFTATNDYLESENISITFKTDSLFSCEYEIPDTLARVSLYEGVNSEGILDTLEIRIWLSDEKISGVSPILSNDIPISISFYDDNSHELLATFLLYALGEIDIAEKNLLAFQTAVNNDVLRSTIDYYLGNIALMKGGLDLAIERYNNKYWTSIGEFHGTNLTWGLVQIGETDQAIEIMTHGIEQYESFGYSQYPSLLADRAQLYALTFDYTSAIADMDSVIDYTESNDYTMETIAPLYKQRGDIIMLIYEWNRALEDYNTAIELAPDYAEAYYRRGILLYTMVEREDAIADFETYLELNQNGKFADSAREYIENIQIELDALGE